MQVYTTVNNQLVVEPLRHSYDGDTILLNSGSIKSAQKLLRINYYTRVTENCTQHNGGHNIVLLSPLSGYSSVYEDMH